MLRAGLDTNCPDGKYSSPTIRISCLHANSYRCGRESNQELDFTSPDSNRSNRVNFVNFAWEITVTRVGPVGWRALLGREARAVGRFRGDPPSCASPRRHHGHAGAAEPPAADPPAGAGDVAGMRRPRRVRLLRRERSGDPHVAGHLRVPRDVPASALRGAAAQVTHLLRQAAAA